MFLEDCEHLRLERKGTTIEGKVLQWMDKKDVIQFLEPIQSQQQSSAGVWVKASERLPQLFKKDILIRYNECANNIWDKQLGDKNTIKELLENGWIDVEWLDESHPTPQQSISDEDIEAIAINEYPSQAEINSGERTAFGKGFKFALSVNKSEGWVSVEDRLPENLEMLNDRVMFLQANGIQRFGTYDDQFQDWTDDCGGVYKDVTHWQPLPPLPHKTN